MKIEIIHMVASTGLGDAIGIEGAGADNLSHRRGHDDGERVAFSSIFWIVLLRTHAVTSARGRGIGGQRL